jgi:hypothetical protein
MRVKTDPETSAMTLKKKVMTKLIYGRKLW